MSQVSVIIPTHNRPHLLPRAVESALSAATDVEVIVVDDASTDDTAKVCRTLAGIKYIRLDLNQGVAGARNVGILHSTGEYISFLDDDDGRLPRILDLQVEALASMPEAGLIYGQALIADQQGRASADYYPQHCPQGDVFWELLGQNFIPCGTVVFRRSCLERVGLLDPAVPGIDDWDLWVRISSLYTVASFEQPVMIWRKSTPASGQGTSRAARLVNMSTRQLQRKWLELPRAASAPASVRREAWRLFSKNVVAQLAFETMRALRHRQFISARNNILAALRLHPRASASAAISSSARRHLWGGGKVGVPPDDSSTYFMQKHPNKSK